MKPRTCEVKGLVGATGWDCGRPHIGPVPPGVYQVLVEANGEPKIRESFDGYYVTLIPPGQSPTIYEGKYYYVALEDFRKLE